MHVPLYKIIPFLVACFFIAPALAESEEAWLMAHQIQSRPGTNVDEALDFWYRAYSVQDRQAWGNEVKDILEASRRTKIEIPSGTKGWYNLVNWLKEEFRSPSSGETPDNIWVQCKGYLYERVYDEPIDDEIVLVAVKFARELEAIERGVPETPAADMTTPEQPEPAVGENPKD